MKIRVWELPVRLFHWLLVLSIIGLFVTGKIGGNYMEWHKKIGYLVLGLISFRVIWGFVGGEHARFLNFVRGPGAVLTYAKSMFDRSAKTTLGHNPMGALSVLAILGVVGFQAVSGLFADDDILMKGPYAEAVSNQTVSLLTKLHKWNSNVILGLVVLHLAAVSFYVFFKREALVRAMFTGDKQVDSAPNEAQSGNAATTAAAERARPIWLSWFVAIVVGVLTWAVTARPFW